jgi:hypothetical protein
MPTFTVLGQGQSAYNDEIVIFIQPGQPGSRIYYTTNGTTPGPSNGTVHLCARAYLENAISETRQKLFAFETYAAKEKYRDAYTSSMSFEFRLAGT